MTTVMTRPIPSNLPPIKVLYVSLVISYIESLEGKTIYEMFFPHKNLLRAVSESVHHTKIPKMSLVYCSDDAHCIIFVKEKEMKLNVTNYNGKDINIDIYIHESDNNFKQVGEAVFITDFVYNQKDLV